MENYSLNSYLAIFSRRRTVLFATITISMLGTIAVTALWSTYQSSATIQIQAPDIRQGMTSPTGAPASLADQRIEQIQQQITATSTLVDMILKFDLYAKARNSVPMTDVVDGMRKKIKLTLVSADLANPNASQRLDPSQLAAIAFTLDFTYSDPSVAQQVCNELVSRFLDADLKRRRSESQSTTAFLDMQVQALEQTMAEQERRIAEFRAEHPDSRPEALVFNQQMAATAEINILDVERQLTALDKTRGDLRAQLASIDPYSRVLADGQVLTTPAIQLKALQAQYATLNGHYGPSHPDLIKLRHQIEALQAQVGQPQDTAELQAQIIDTRTRLAALQKTYGTTHPDVLALRRQLTALEGQLATRAHDPTSQSAIKKDADNPAYLMIVSQIQANESQYQALLAQRAQLRQQRDRYRQIVAEAPANEQSLAALSRDYDNAQLRYRDLKEKKLSADMADQMEQGRIAERLVVLEPPKLPSDTRPPRMVIFLAGFLLSLASGGAGVMLAETLSRSVHGTRHLAMLTGAPPLAAIPHIYTAAERRRIWRVRLQVGFCLLLLAGGGLAIHQSVMSLDVIWSMIGPRLGLPS